MKIVVIDSGFCPTSEHHFKSISGVTIISENIETSSYVDETGHGTSVVDVLHESLDSPHLVDLFVIKIYSNENCIDEHIVCRTLPDLQSW